MFMEEEKTGAHGVSRAGLMLFHAIGKMRVAPEPDLPIPANPATAHENRRVAFGKLTAPSLLRVSPNDSGEEEEEEDGTIQADSETRDGDKLMNCAKKMSEDTDTIYPLHYPKNDKHLKTLLQAHPDLDPNASNFLYDKPIHAIVKKPAVGQREKDEKVSTLFNLLTYSRADVNATAASETTALHMAAKDCDLESARVLLAWDANVNAQNAYMMTPLDCLEDPWRLHDEKDLKHEIAKFQPSQSKWSLTSPVVDVVSPYPSAEGCTDAESESDQNRSEFIQLLESLGGKRGKDLVTTSTTPIQAQPCSPELFSPSAFANVKPIFSEQVMRKIGTHEKFIESLLDCATGENAPSGSEASELVTRMRDLKILKKSGSRILCLDGGGMRGLIQVEALAAIEEATGRKIIELFDWFVGTSIGGVIVLSLVYGGVTFHQLKQIAGRIRSELLGGAGAAAHVREVDTIIKDYIPEDLNMCDVTYPRVLVTGVDKSSVNLKLRFFNNCFGDEFSTQPVWKVAVYTTAAPLYLIERDNYVDGGVLANNPSMQAIARIQNHYFETQGMSLPISLVVSGGTGQAPDQPLGNIDVLAGTSLLMHIKDLAKIKNVVAMFGAALTQSEGAAMECRAYCQQLDILYLRLDISLDKSLDMFISSLNDLVDMILKAKLHFRDSPDIREMAIMLNSLAKNAEKANESIHNI